VAPISPGAGPPPRRLLRGGEKLQHLVGRRLLVGVTVRDAAGTVLSRTQFCGPVLEVADGVVVVDKGDEQALLPSDDLAYGPAPRGRYTLTGSGEVVVDPDFVTTWDVVAEPTVDLRPLEEAAQPHRRGDQEPGPEQPGPG
jgi:hypothetical protein